MTCVAVEPREYLSQPTRPQAVRAAVFWGFILLIIVSPAALGAMILAQA